MADTGATPVLESLVDSVLHTENRITKVENDVEQLTTYVAGLVELVGRLHNRVLVLENASDRVETLLMERKEVDG